MTEAALSSSDASRVKGHQRMLGLLLAAAMFVLVVDTSLMNVSISAVVPGSRHDRQRRPVAAMRWKLWCPPRSS